MEELQDVYLMKSSFHLRGADSLWSQCMRLKYCSNCHPTYALVRPQSSHYWKALASVRDTAEDNIHWVIRKGEVNFWVDSWLPKGQLLYLDHSRWSAGVLTNSFLRNGEWNFAALTDIVPPELIKSIGRSSIATDG